jgi:xanthine dehydrogenase YagR molybdenum-binding subunit
MSGRTVNWRNSGLIGEDTPRLDGRDKASGFAKYTYDINPEGTLYAKLLTCTHAKAKITRLNVDKAKAIKGVHTVFLFKKVGDDCNWDGDIVAAVAAETADIAEDGVRAIEVAYEVGKHFVDEDDLDGAQAAERTKDLVDKTDGDPDEAIKGAAAVHEGYYGIATISHMCLEPHGAHVQWNEGGDGPKVIAHNSTQAVSTTGPQFAQGFGLDASDVRVICNYIGGGFGSKFAADEWGLAATQMSKDTGRPVRLMLDRATELKTPGTRPSGFGKVTVAADEDGKVVAWKSHHWGTSGPQGGTIDGNQMPYVFSFANQSVKSTGIATDCGPNRAWRAPNHPQLCAITDAALTDLAAKLDMDPVELYRVNLEAGAVEKPAQGKLAVYQAELDRAVELMEWDDKWHTPGEGDGPVKKGVGVALHRWGGRAGASTCTVKVHPDGGAEVFLGSQDLGTGTRTVIAMVLADTLGLPLDRVKVHIGSNAYPPANPSGGSITVGGVSGPVRRAALDALWQICDKVAAKYGVPADDLDAFGGRIWHDHKEVCRWEEACRLLGTMPLETSGKGPENDGLTDQLVGGVQMADVSVDTETGIVTINKMVAVQDCGTIINPMTARSQVYGGLIMGIAYALSEERIMDNQTGRYINADLETYKLPRIGDIGELVVDMYQPESEFARGVVGLGEPPVISTGAAISNAVFNALGVRVPVLPLTPKRVLDALAAAKA